MKPFAPKPFTPGAAVTWTHVYPDGSTRERTGIVWSLAPVLRQSNAVWVTPDDADLTDAYPMLVVSVPGKRAHHVANKFFSLTFQLGEAYSEVSDTSPTGALAAGAATWTARLAETRLVSV